MKVLILEDEGLVAMLLEDLLTDLGHEIFGVAANVQQAEALVADGRPDLAIMDVNLNGRSPFDFARKLLDGATPIIFATGYGSVSSEDPALTRAPVLAKPFDALQLRDAIARATGQA